MPTLGSMSPRRSSRARTTQPPLPIPAPGSSSSSVSSARTERATRFNHKQSSPHKSPTPHSLSEEEPEEPQRGTLKPPPLTRRRTREVDNDEDELMKVEDEADDDVNEEDEITRCVCGQQEYPGPPVDVAKSKDGQSSTLTDPDVVTDDAGLFIQCDICKVWQHGGCVGIMDEATSPEEYFCEECRKDLHNLMKNPNGQKYSRYLPIYEQYLAKNTRKSSISKESENKAARERERISRASVESLGKRRSTMNSRAAYDEDEVLRKVLEESKIEGGGPSSESSNKKKRSREESEEFKQETKRQRTSSTSRSGSPVIESEDDTSKSATARHKNRGAAARSQREKELRDQERERERAEAASRRKGRAERRKAEESEALAAILVEETPIAPTPSEPDTPMADLKPLPASRKSGRPLQKRQSRLGRNQYTRDTAVPTANGASPTPNDTPNSPGISGTNGVANGHDSSDGTAATKPAKSKNWRLQKLSWNEIKRPAGAMQNYITQRQVELAGEKGASVTVTQSPEAMNGVESQGDAKGDGHELEAFKKLNTLQMMDDLSRELVHWQRLISTSTEK